MTLFMAECLGCRLAMNLHDKGSSANSSIVAPLRHLCGWHMQGVSRCNTSENVSDGNRPDSPALPSKGCKMCKKIIEKDNMTVVQIGRG